MSRMSRPGPDPHAPDVSKPLLPPGGPGPSDITRVMIIIISLCANLFTCLVEIKQHGRPL